MEGSRVSGRLPFCVETEAEGRRRNSTADATALEEPSEIAGNKDASGAAGWKTSEYTPGHQRESQAGEWESDAADRGPPVCVREEKYFRLDVEEAYAPTISSETCETPRSSECHTEATAGDSTVPSCSDTEVEADTFADHELPVGTIGEKYFIQEMEETYCPALSSETSESHTGATAGDSTVPSCSDIDVDADTVADHELPVEIIEKKCRRLEVEAALSLGVFSETSESLSRSTESHTDAAAAGDSTVPSLSDADEPDHFEGVSSLCATGEESRGTEEPCEGWATDFSTMSSEIEEGVRKEVRHGKRRPLQGNKPSTKRLPRVALVALFDALDAFIGDTGSISPGPTNGARGLGRASGSFSTSRRCSSGSREPHPTTPHSPEEVPTEADVWASKRLLATLAAIGLRLENVEQCVLSYRSNGAETYKEVMEEQRQQLQEVEKKMAGVMSLGVGEQRSRRPFQQATVEMLMRRMLRLRDVLQAGGGGGCFTELDVQMALKGARRHLRTAQAAAAKLSLLLAADGDG